MFPKFREELLSTKLIVMKFYQHYDLYIGGDENDYRIHAHNNLLNKFAKVLLTRKKEVLRRLKSNLSMDKALE